MDMPYYVIGYSLEAERFFRQLILLFAVHRTSTSMFQFLASVCQTLGAAMTAGGFAVLIVLLFCGFVITHSSNAWVVEVSFLVSPLSYGEIGLSVNEFLAPRWQKLNANAAPGSSLQEKLAKIQGSQDSNEGKLVEEKSKNSPMKGDFNFLLPVGWSYFLNHLIGNISGCEEKKKLQLLSDVTSALRPAVHTALIGVSGAGKTTLLDCMAGRKTTGHIEGQINLLNLLIVSWLLSYKLIASHTKSKPAIPCSSIPLNQIERD
ncbi:hypothetical protein Pint_21525 [Pistacia integerrima]|uniref:Uncharacterized protein n=1 Tax=Pistacia integerrima TaxID=434235 RepID=A0ACC0XA13_9ROSI|nr:hypothetical protein Pint_21525 [Pistacia integerrima]